MTPFKGIPRRPPRGVGRWLARQPIRLYRRRLGWLLGYRFLLLTHRGRRSGRLHRTVLEVICYGPETHESVVISGFGRGADWYRNIRTTPALEVQTGRLRYVPEQRFLSVDDGAAVLAEFERRHRLAAQFIPWLVRWLAGVPYEASPAGRRAVAEAMPMVALRPAVHPSRAAARSAGSG